LYECNIAFEPNDLTVLTEYFDLVNIYVGHRFVPFIFSIPSGKRIIHGEITSFENNLAPTVVDPQRFHPVQAASPDVKNIIGAVCVW
jgi:hypothetical protein